MKLLIASNNQHKIQEIRAILQGKFDEILSLSDLNINCDPDETGSTFQENAMIKAKAISALTDLPVLADDTGLCVDALGGKPGVHTARYATTNDGFGHDNAANRKKLLYELQGETNRSAHFECAVVLMFPDGKVVTANGKVYGHITTQECGTGGFGYDSVFFCDELNKTFAQASAEEKNSISHRGRALHALLETL